MKALTTRILFFSLMLLPVSGCKKFLDVGQPKTQLQTTDVFSNDNSAIAAVAGLYSLIGSNLCILNGAESLFGALSSDELSPAYSSATYDPFFHNSILATDYSIDGNFWSPAYYYIYMANSILKGIDNSSGLSPTVKSQLKGQALLTRAIIYFYLVSLFGDVPLVSDTDYEKNANLPREKATVIFNQIRNDLMAAESVLPGSYAAVNHALPEKWTAVALLARLNLYLENFQEAETYCTRLIESGNFILEDNLSAVFNNNSRETIFQIARETGNTTLSQYLLPYDEFSIPQFTIQQALLNGFEYNDQRRIAWIDKTEIDGVDYYFPSKYKNNKTEPVNECYIVMRLAEIYLVRAEARAQQNDLDGAMQDVNTIRVRAGLSPATFPGKEEIISAINIERQHELFTEGQRWLDLKRTASATSILSQVKTNWQSSDTLFPIPFSEIQKNPLLTQNTGY